MMKDEERGSWAKREEEAAPRDEDEHLSGSPRAGCLHFVTGAIVAQLINWVEETREEGLHKRGEIIRRVISQGI